MEYFQKIWIFKNLEYLEFFWKNSIVDKLKYFENLYLAKFCPKYYCPNYCPKFRAGIHQVLSKYWPSIDQVLAKHWPSNNQSLVKYWQSIGQALIKYWPNICQAFAKYWHWQKQVKPDHWLPKSLKIKQISHSGKLSSPQFSEIMDLEFHSRSKKWQIPLS